MSYTVNQINYATPLSSAPGLFNAPIGVDSTRYFTLFNNTLDGSYVPMSGDVGIWGNVLSDADGRLPSAFVMSVDYAASIKAFYLTGGLSSYPVDFTVTFYNGNDVVYTIEETGNASAAYAHPIYNGISITSYTISITRISAPNDVVRLYNVYHPDHTLRRGSVSIRTSEQSVIITGQVLKSKDTLKLTASSKQSSVMVSAVAKDKLTLSPVCKGNPINIHSIMKRPTRHVHGKVDITYTDPMLDGYTSISSAFTAYNSDVSQVLDHNHEVTKNLFTLYENDLSGKYHPSTASTQVGWVSRDVSNHDGVFDTPQVLRVDMAARPITGLPIYFNDSHDCAAVDFDVRCTHEDGSESLFEIRGNTSYTVTVTERSIPDVVSITIIVYRVSKGLYPVSVVDIPVRSTFLYEGHQLMSIDLLEELTYEDDVEALGGISANEITVVLDNSNKDFYFNNVHSPVARQLRRNRRIVPQLGAEVTPGLIEWYKLGTFWSYKWDVPVNSLVAKVVGFDTIGLLDTTTFTKHTVLVDKSIGELIEYVLNDARNDLDFIQYDIDPALYNVIIPYAWFQPKSHTAALRRISECFPMHIYCNREGTICAKPQKLRMDFFYDTWADDTNVIDKSYSSLYTTLPNIINVTVCNPVVLPNEELARDDKAVPVNGATKHTVTFSKPYLSNFAIVIDKDDAVQYTYELYSWGIEFTFTGIGEVHSVICFGDCVDISNTSVVSHIDELSVRLNGAVSRDVRSDFIQVGSHADIIINRVLSLSEYDKYDATVNYRGDIALTINDPILLLDGIAPDNRYNIKRHQLFWNGALTGSADLNT